MQPLNLVVNLQVPEDVILQRIMGMYWTKQFIYIQLTNIFTDRWVHIPSGRVYNLSYNPPRVPGVDDVTGEPLTKRPDDTPEVFKVRLEQHHAMATPLLDHYNDIVVNCKGDTSDEIYPQIEKEIVNRFGILPNYAPQNYSIASLKKLQMEEHHQEEKMSASASN